jgi:predicted unusual protein kinase regulating ubiquinone biosynthesis (AarF/ABC1/UbiB family)
MPTEGVNRLTQAIRFVRVSRLLLWTIWVIYRERRRVLRARARGDTEAQPNIEVLINVLVAFRKTAVQLGVLMIKLGQFLSSRADLLPQRALDVLSSLQDEVPPAPYSHVKSVIESELHKPVSELFSSLDTEATAAASLGQVHKGVLAATGEVVAVKVQRPNIEQLVNMDLSTIRFVIWVISLFADNSEFIDLNAFYREFRRTIFEEIDYVREAANARRFKEIFADKPHILIPGVIDGYTSKRVLVLDWVDGIKVNDYAQLEAAGVSRYEVAKRTVEAYFYQFFEVGFFHADPHPGNIFVLPGSPRTPASPAPASVSSPAPASAPSPAPASAPSAAPASTPSPAPASVSSPAPASAPSPAPPSAPSSAPAADAGPTVAFVDFGMVGSLNRATKQALKDLFLGFVVNNPHNMVEALARLGFIGEGANMSAIERGVALMMEEYHGMTLGEARDLNIRDVAHEIEDLFYRQPFRIPAQFAFVGRAIGTLSGLATGLAPEFNLVAVAVPYAQNFLGLGRENVGQTAQQVLRQAMDAGRTLLTLPATFDRVLAKLEAGQIEVRVSDEERNGTNGTPAGRARRRRGSTQPTSGWFVPLVICVAGLAAGTVLSLNQVLIPAWFCLGIGGLAALSLLIRR